MTEAPRFAGQIRGLLRRSFLTPRNDGSEPGVFVQALYRSTNSNGGYIKKAYPNTYILA